MKRSQASEHEQLATQAGRRLEIPPLEPTAFYAWAKDWLARQAGADELFSLLLPIRMTRAEWERLIAIALEKGQTLHQTFNEGRAS